MKHYTENEKEELYRHLPRAEDLTIKREFLAGPIAVLILIILISALFNLGYIQFPYYQAQAAQNRITRIQLTPPRGEILDRAGRPLAVNHSVYDCYFVTSDDVEADIDRISILGEFLGLSADQLDAVIESREASSRERSLASEIWAAEGGEFGARSILIKRDLNHVEVASILERSAEFPRAFLELSYRRSYPAGRATAQVVGYMGEISSDELEDWTRFGYSMGDVVGKAGLERQYDNLLRGHPGERLVSVDARGRILGEAGMVPAVVPDNGAVIVHESDVRLLTEGNFADFPGEVRVNMRGGLIQAVDSGFAVVNERERAVQRTLFTDEGSGGVYDEWYVFREHGEVARIGDRVVMRQPVTEPVGGSPLRITLDLEMQREILDIFGEYVGGVVAMDPRDGSILAMVSAPGYDPNLFNPSGVDPAGWLSILNDPDHPLLNRPIQNDYVPGSTFKIVTALAACESSLNTGTWMCTGSLEVGNRTFRCWLRSGHGRVNFTQAIAESCDVAFWTMAQELGHERIAEMAQRLGLGQQTNVDIPNEATGLIPDDEWKQERIGERWYTGDTMNMCIGQGFVQLTVLQVAQMTSVVANGGYMIPPHFNRLLTPAPSLIERIEINNSAIDAVRRGLRECVADGTGRACNFDWIDIAGKTGTAEDPPREEPHSWFTSFGPYENPRLVLVVFSENGAYQDETAVMIASRIWQCDSVRAYLEEES